MRKIWDKKSIQSYEDAVSFLNYPEDPLKKYFDSVIRPEDTVLEIGSGIGIVSLYLAPMCKRLMAVENDERGCEYLEKRAAEKELKNIEIFHGIWPDKRLAMADVSVALYICNLFTTKESIEELLASTRRAGMIMISKSGEKGGFPAPLKDHLGIPRKKPTANKDEGEIAAELLEAEGVKVTHTVIEHDFGQPVAIYDEATRFMLKHLQLDETYFSKVREVVEELTEIRKGRIYVPYVRKNDLVLFEK